jgi:hypothetical protein
MKKHDPVLLILATLSVSLLVPIVILALLIARTTP